MVFEKWIRYFKHIFIWLQLEFGKYLDSSTCKRISFNVLASSVQLKIEMFLGTALLLDEPVSKVARRFTGTGQKRRCQLRMTSCHTKTEKDNAPKLTEECQSCSISICWEHSMWVCHGCLQWNFILYFIFIVLKKLQNLPFLKIKVDMFVVYSLTSYSHLKQKVNRFLKKLELCVFYRPNQ